MTKDHSEMAPQSSLIYLSFGTEPSRVPTPVKVTALKVVNKQLFVFHCFELTSGRGRHKQELTTKAPCEFYRLPAVVVPQPIFLTRHKLPQVLLTI